MKDFREIIAKNICALRTDAGMTQLRLAEALNYSDKAVSKWERGEAIPDVIVLKRIADLFGVTVDYLLCEKHDASPINAKAIKRITRRNHLVVAFTSVVLVWLVATVAFAILSAVGTELPAWMAFIYGVPCAFIVMLVFNCIWGRRRLNILTASPILWGVILSIYLTVTTLTSYDPWILFVIGAPLQIILMFIPGISFLRFGVQEERGSDL